MVNNVFKINVNKSKVVRFNRRRSKVLSLSLQLVFLARGDYDRKTMDENKKMVLKLNCFFPEMC
jgi:hypothetical protein